MSGSNSDVVPIVAEFAEVTKRSEVTGRVRVNVSTTDVEELVPLSLTSDEVEVTRVPIDQEIKVPPATRTEGAVTIVPVVEERVIIEKRLILVEEIHIRRITKTDDTTISVTLRKQEAAIERQTYPDKPTEERKS